MFERFRPRGFALLKAPVLTRVRRLTLEELLAKAGVNTRNARKRLDKTRRAAEKWLKTARAPEPVKDYMRKFVRLGTDLDIPLEDLAILVGVAIYVISPLDFIPDFIPGIGWLDDAWAVKLAMQRVGERLAKY